MMSTERFASIFFIVWIFSTILFLFNFNVSGGYLAIINFLFIIAALLTSSSFEED